MGVGVRAVALLACGVVAVDRAVKVLVLRDSDVGGEDLDGERAARCLLGVGVQLRRAGVAVGGHGHRKLTWREERGERRGVRNQSR